jgi:hypothetical protein
MFYRAVALALSAVLAGAALTGCSSTPNPGPTATRYSGDAPFIPVPGEGYDLTVPVLWAGKDRSGNPIGGIEPAGIWVGFAGHGKFSMDLSTVAAQGAGPAWMAATSTAATVGTLFSSAVPDTVSLKFTITGPIDGPSAGGILTVGILAGVHQLPLDPTVTMTGTISPDGSLGIVGGVASKVKAAAEAGYQTVILPPGNEFAEIPGTGVLSDMVEYGASLGVHVVLVPTLAEAYKLFTGQRLVADLPGAYELSEPEREATRATTAAMAARLKNALAEPITSRISPGLVAKLQAASTRVQRNIDHGSTAIAYGLAVDTYVRWARAAQEARVEQVFASEGPAAASEYVRDAIHDELAEARTVLTTDSTQHGHSEDELLALPTALSLVTYGIGSLTALEDSLPEVQTREDFARVGRVLGEQSATIHALYPDARAVVFAAANSDLPPEATTAGILHRYSVFLQHAGDANRDYVQTVLQRELADTSTTSTADSLVPLIQHLGSMATNPELSLDPLASEIVQSAFARSYYVATTQVLSSAQVYGISGSGIGDDPLSVNNGSAIITAVDNGSAMVDTYSKSVQAKGRDAGSSVWAADWSIEGGKVLATESVSRATAGSMRALTQLWSESLCVLMINAAPTFSG